MKPSGAGCGTTRRRIHLLRSVPHLPKAVGGGAATRAASNAFWRRLYLLLLSLLTQQPLLYSNVSKCPPPTRPPPHLPATTPSSQSSTPSGLDQYAWLKVSVINTRVVFQETLSSLVLICTWIVSSMDRRWAPGINTFTVELTEGISPRGARLEAKVHVTFVISGLRWKTKNPTRVELLSRSDLVGGHFPFCLLHIFKMLSAYCGSHCKVTSSSPNYICLR